MSKRRTWTAVLVGAALASAVSTMSACGVQPGGDPTTACTDEARTAGEPGDAEPLLTLGSALLSPTIVYSDGAVVIPTAQATAIDASDAAGAIRVPMMMPGYSGDEPGGFQAGWLSDCELEAVIGLADDLFTDNVDFGAPQVTDSGSMSVSYREKSDSIYAFSRHDPARWGDLSTSQGQARQDLADLWDVVENSAELTGAVEIDRLFLVLYGSIGDSTVTDWPLEAPLSELSEQSCVSITDPTEVQQLLERLEQDEPILDETDWRMAIVAAAPGVPDCEG